MMVFKRFHEAMVKTIHNSIVLCLQQTAHFSVIRPRLVLLTMTFMSIVCILIGCKMNFYMETDEVKLWTPYRSKALTHGEWLKKESGYKFEGTQLQIIIHGNGENILGRECIDYSFKAVNAIKSLQRSNDTGSIKSSGVTNFFNDDYDLFRSIIHSDEAAILVLSIIPVFPNGNIVNRNELFGFPNENSAGLLHSVLSYVIQIDFSNSTERSELERAAMEEILKLKHQWHVQNSPCQLEAISSSSYSDEVHQTLDRDKVLLILVFLIMSTFSSITYYQRDRVKSSCILLGLGAPVSISLGLLLSFGVMFIIGIRFSSLTFMLPFIMMGIGLDDAFIITGAYSRTKITLTTEERMKITLQDCGLSIFVTTLTTSTAFCLSLTSEIPAIKEFSMYAIISVWVCFIYQLTFFTAIIKLNDTRIANQTYDLFPCCTRESNGDTNLDLEGNEENTINVLKRYGSKIINLSKSLKIIIVIVFICFSGFFGALSTSQLKCSFDLMDMVPEESYVKSFAYAINNYYRQRSYYDFTIIFRNPNSSGFSQSQIQESMHNYLDQLLEIPYVDQPTYFWLDDFEKFVKSRKLEGFDFVTQIDMFLQDGLYSKLYKNAIIRSESGDLLTSAVQLPLNIQLGDTVEQVAFLSAQEKITENHDVNQFTELDYFFTFSPQYYLWDFFRQSLNELIWSTIIGMAAVFVITLIFAQNPFISLFVTSTVAMIYIDVLGIIQYAGLTINPVTYVALILSIGLMVDYIVHVIFRYSESKEMGRDEKVLECLSTMGSAIFLGASSTILGVMPLAFSSSTIFLSIFIVFLSFILLSLVHAILYLPILLSLIGPQGPCTEEQHVESIQDEPQRDRKGTDETAEIRMEGDGEDTFCDLVISRKEDDANVRC